MNREEKQLIHRGREAGSQEGGKEGGMDNFTVKRQLRGRKRK